MLTRLDTVEIPFATVSICMHRTVHMCRSNSFCFDQSSLKTCLNVAQLIMADQISLRVCQIDVKKSMTTIMITMIFELCHPTHLQTDARRNKKALDSVEMCISVGKVLHMPHVYVCNFAHIKSHIKY